MRLWSKGLGKLILPFDLGEAESVQREGDSILIEGRIVERKVNWPYRIHLTDSDMVDFTRLMAENPLIQSYLRSRLGFSLVGFVLLLILTLPFRWLFAKKAPSKTVPSSPFSTTEEIQGCISGQKG
jgi:hypothetical protein